MREYKIGKTDLGYFIYRKKYNGKLVFVQYYYSNEGWGTNKTLARNFYHKDAAMSALVIVRHNEGEKSDKDDNNNVSNDN